MPTTILLIENDPGFARELTEALEANGYLVRGTGDGKEGLDLAKEVAPAAIVLCVELPKMSGYSICQKLKKDDALRGIPLILTSAEATLETFEQHRKLKARAEDYLLKPFSGADLIAKLTPLAGAPEAPASSPAPGEEEVVSLEEEFGLGVLTAGQDGDLPALDLASLPDEPGPAGAPSSSGGVDEDLALLDDAFAGLSSPPPPQRPLLTPAPMHAVVTPRPPPQAASPRPAAPPPAPPPPPVPAVEPDDAGAALDLALDGEQPVASDDLDAAAASLPLEDEGPGRAELGTMDDETDLALGALGGDDSHSAALDALDALDGPPADQVGQPDEPALDLEAPPQMDFSPELAAALDLAPEGGPQKAPPAPLRPASADALRAAGIALLDDPPPASPPNLKVVPPHVEPPPARPAVLDGAGAAELSRLEAELADQRASLAARDAELRELHDRADALTHRAAEAESSLAEREAEVASQKARAEALAAQVKRGETDLKAGRDEARKAADLLRAAEDRARSAEAQVAAATEKVRAAEAQARAAETQSAATAEKARAAEEQARAAVEKARAAEALSAAAAEKTRAAEDQARAAEAKAAAAGEKARAAEAQAVAAAAEAARHRAGAADTARDLATKVAALAVATAAAARLEAVEREAEELKTELIVARGEVEGARSEVEKRSAELKKRIADLEAANAKNEERVVKAYLKIKGDEKVRDKARKALAIALQLLEEGLPPETGAARPPATGASKLE